LQCAVRDVERVIGILDAARTLIEAVDLALRRLVGDPLTKDEALALRGSGWHGDLQALRAPRPPYSK